MIRQLLFLTILFLPATSLAFDVTISSGVFQLTGIEPSLNNDGQPLTDLDRIEVTYSIPFLSVVKAGKVSIPASSATGEMPFTVEITVEGINNFDGELEFAAVACDNAKAGGRSPLDNCSDPTVMLKRVDLLAPGIIQ